MLPENIANCDKLTAEVEDGFVTYYQKDSNVIMTVTVDGSPDDVIPISTIQRSEGANGIMVTYIDDNYLMIEDGQEFELNVWKVAETL